MREGGEVLEKRGDGGGGKDGGNVHKGGRYNSYFTEERGR